MWLHIPKTTSACVPASADSMKPCELSCPEPVPSLTSSGKLMSSKQFLRVSKRVPWMTRRFGMTSPHLVGDSSVVAWLESLPGGHASPILSQASEKEPATSAGSGMMSSESSESPKHSGSLEKTLQDSCGTPIAILDPGSQTWKSPQMTLLAAWVPFSGIWPVSGCAWNGVVYERPKLERRISANESSYWPTARAMTGGPESAERKQELGRTESGGGDLAASAAAWSTPRREDGESAGNHPGAQDSLTGQTRGWMTPSAGDAKGRQYTYDGHDRTKPRLALEGETLNWHTPTQGDHKIDLKGEERYGTTTEDQRLRNQAALWQSPQSRDWKSGEIMPETAAKHLGSRPLNEQVIQHHSASMVQGWGLLALSMTSENFTDEALAALGNAIRPNSTTPSDGPSCWCGTPGCVLPSHKRKLNPLFVAVLMGFSPFWLTGEPHPCGRLGMQFMRTRRLALLSNY